MKNIEKIVQMMNNHLELFNDFKKWRNELDKNDAYQSAMSYHQGAIDALYDMLKDEENFESLSMSNKYYVITKDGGICI